MSNSKNDARFSEIDELIFALRQFIGQGLYESSFALGKDLIAKLDVQKDADAEQLDRLADAYKFSAMAARACASRPDEPGARDWMMTALDCEGKALDTREKFHEAVGRIKAEDCGALIAAAYVLAAGHVSLGNLESGLVYSKRCQDLQVKFADVGFMPEFYLGNKACEAKALLLMKRAPEALVAINEALATVELDQVSDANLLKQIADHCRLKATILGACNAKKLN